MGLASAEILKQISVLMNDKNDRHTRYEVMLALEGSWAASVSGTRPSGPRRWTTTSAPLSRACAPPPRL